MNDNYELDDLIDSLQRDIVMERYYPLIDCKKALTAILNKAGAVQKDQVSEAVIEELRGKLGDPTARLFARYLHIYDFNKAKLREISDYIGTKDYDALSALLRLPGVRRLRAQLYLNSGVTLEVLAEKSTEEIRSMVRAYIQRENRAEIVPQPKEVNCHRAVAKMILHTDHRRPRDLQGKEHEDEQSTGRY